MQIVTGLFLFVALTAAVVFLVIHHREFRQVLAQRWPIPGAMPAWLTATTVADADLRAVDPAD